MLVNGKTSKFKHDKKLQAIRFFIPMNNGFY